ncbi:LAMI_0F02828g1_1 [Lachancea mirantina]|uniref:Diphthamide biosynthesis protein 4 n=1 Tax=Lachancea mirantina TaxID=1230905 RepID=A0A1G4JWW6_9SACH|nr:LAMI_0F02828g1_1 [Lachancea mirantina]
MNRQRTYYEILGLDADTDIEGVKKAYRTQLLEAHPDKNRSINGSQASVQEIKQAYATLVNLDLRAKYDAYLMENSKKLGFHSTGDGLDSFSLDELEFDPEKGVFAMDCPRCQRQHGFEVSEKILEEHCIERREGGFQVVLQCSSCSLWVNVIFDIVEEYESS